jgi:hypothetical protein
VYNQNEIRVGFFNIMKQILILLVVLFCGVFIGCNFSEQNVEAQTSVKSNKNVDDDSTTDKKSAVLVELFTSEGCSSCPPADRLLARIEKEQPYKDIEVITLALHVDYWDYLGWKDEFSSAMFTRRQDIYAQALRTGQTYTPQMVVDGSTGFVGNDAENAAKAIISNAKIQKAQIGLSSEQDRLNIKVSDMPKHEKLTVYLAVTEDNIATNVKRGENSGKKLEHTAVVRELRSLGMLDVDQSDFSYDQAVQILPNWKKENLKYVVFLQENLSRKVLGVSRVKAN